MENLLNKLNNFFFGKYLKLFLFLFGIAYGVAHVRPYHNLEAEVIGTNIRYGISAIGLIFIAVWIHLKESKNNQDS